MAGKYTITARCPFAPPRKKRAINNTPKALRHPPTRDQPTMRKDPLRSTGLNITHLRPVKRRVAALSRQRPPGPSLAAQLNHRIEGFRRGFQAIECPRDQIETGDVVIALLPGQDWINGPAAA